MLLSLPGHNEVQLVADTPETSTITYEVDHPGIVFVSQSFYPGWVANGGLFKIVEVFGAFQGIIIPRAGRGRIILRFDPPVLHWSIAISVVSLLLGVGIIHFGNWRRGPRERHGGFRGGDSKCVRERDAPSGAADEGGG